MSRKPGIGSNYTQDGKVKDYFNYTKNSYATLKNGIKSPLGRYLKNKIFEETQAQRAAGLRATQYVREQEAAEWQYYLDKHNGDIIAASIDQNKIKNEQYKESQRMLKRQLKRNNKL